MAVNLIDRQEDLGSFPSIARKERGEGQGGEERKKERKTAFSI